MTFPPAGQSGPFNTPRSTPIGGDTGSPIITDRPHPLQGDVPSPMSAGMPAGAPGGMSVPPLVPEGGGGNWGMRIMVTIVVLGVLGGVGAGVWGVMRGVDAVQQANEVSDPDLSDDDLDALDLAADEEFLFNGEAARAVVEALDDEIPGSPTRFTEISLFTDYAIATAQDPSVPARFDRYIWRSGAVQAPTPERDDPDATEAVFTIDDVDWEAITALVEQAPELTGVEDGTVDYLIVSRDNFIELEDIKVRIYVNSPRASAVIEATADGVVTRTF